MKKCNTCFYQEKGYDGKLICKHIQSVTGLEAYEEYKLCDEICECDLYKRSRFKCKDCEGNCMLNQSKNMCMKI